MATMSGKIRAFINISIITACFFWSSLSLASQDFHWEFAGWEGGGCYPNVEFDPRAKDRVYLTSDVAGIWRSDDLGENWRFINHGLENLYIPAIAVAPSDSNILYAAAKNGLYLSRDAGETWHLANNPQGQIKFLRPQSYKPLAVSPLDPKNICIGTAKGKVLCSEDFGQSWVDLDPLKKNFTGEKPIAVVLYTSDAKNLWIGAVDGLFSYDFAKETLESHHESGKNVTDMVISWDNKTIYGAFDGQYGVYYDGKPIEYPTSKNKAEKTFRIALKTDLESDKEQILVFSAVNQGWNGRILTSRDHGANWFPVAQDINLNKEADPTWGWANPKPKTNSLKIDPFNQNVIFMTNGWGVFRSDDSGKTWNEKVKGAPNVVGSDIKVTEGDVWVATMDNGLLKSSDGGQSYETVFPSDHYDNAKAGHVWRVILPQENTIVATSSPWNAKINQVIVSNDGGQNFKLVRDGLPAGRPKKNTVWGEGYPRALAFDPQDPQRIYLGIDGDDGGGLFISDDGGLSWARSQGQPGSLRIYNALTVDPSDPKRIFWGATGKGGGVHVSLDQGKTWRRTLKDMEWVVDLAVAQNGVIYAAGDHSGPAVYVSKDKGESWAKVKLSLGNKGAAEALAVAPGDTKTVAFSTTLWNEGAPGKVFLTADGGKTWGDITGDLPPGAGAAAMSFSPDGKYLFITRYAGSVYRIKIK